MTREEQTDWLCRLRAYLNNGVIFTPWNKEFTEALTGILDQSPKTEQFAKWVAAEIFDDMWEYNKDSFAEIACRKLAKLGIVRAKGDEQGKKSTVIDERYFKLAEDNLYSELAFAIGSVKEIGVLETSTEK